MTVNELRTLVDNLDEYIHVPGGIDRLKNMVLHLAVSGQLVPQDPSEGTGEELYRQIQAEKAELVKQGKLKKQKPLPKIESDDLLPGIPVSWTQVKIGDASIYQQRGKSPKYTAISSYPVVSQKCVRWNRIDWQHVKFITPESIEKYEEFRLLRDGDLLLNSTGTGTMGRVGIYRENKQYDRVVADSHVTIVRFSDFISAGFAHIFFRSPYVQEDVESKASGSTNQIEWNLSSIQNEIMPLPPLGEQRRIVAKVDSIFALIDQLAEVYKSEQTERSKLVASSLAQLAKTENDVKDSLALTHLSEIIRTKADAKILRQTILHLAVSGQLVPQDPSEGSGEELYQKIQAEKAELVKQGKIKRQKPLPEINENEAPFAIPESWKLVRLGGVGVWGQGSGFPQAYQRVRGQDIPFFKVSDMNNNHVYMDNVTNSINTEIQQKIKAKILPEGTIIFPKIGGAIATNKRRILRVPSCIDNNCMGFKGSELLSTEWLFNLFITWDFTKFQSGTALPALNQSTLTNIPVGLPPLAEQKRIVAKTTQLLDLVAELERHLEK